MHEQISSFFTRPPRQTYYQHDLGPQMFPIYSRTTPKFNMGIRIDFSIVNNRNFKLSASFYKPQLHNSEKCLIYLHTHHGSKLEATCLIEPMLSSNINLCLFDFCGYGNSEGDTVTLGIQQSEDIYVVLEQLKRRFDQQYFVLWGRSMGAVAGLLYLSKLREYENSGIVVAIFDSPFYSLQQLALEIGSKNLGVPCAILRPFMFIIKRTLKNQINFEQLELEPVVSSVKTPGIFISSKEDKFVSHEHSEKLYKQYGGNKQLIYIQRDHNQPRNQEQLSPVFAFILKKLSLPTSSKKQKQNNYLSIIQNHFKFITKHELTQKPKDYFDRQWTYTDISPHTDRLQYRSKCQRQNIKQIYTEISSPQHARTKTTKMNHLSKKTKFRNFNQFIN